MGTGFGDKALREGNVYHSLACCHGANRLTASPLRGERWLVRTRCLPFWIVVFDKWWGLSGVVGPGHWSRDGDVLYGRWTQETVGQDLLFRFIWFSAVTFGLWPFGVELWIAKFIFAGLGYLFGWLHLECCELGHILFFLTRLNVRWKIFLLVIYSLFLKRMLYRALLLIATGYIFQDEKTQGLQVQIHIFLISWLPYPSIKVAISQIDLISHGCHIHQLKLQLVKSI
jgi:hypothetical protein